MKCPRSSSGDDDAALALFRKIYDLDRTYAPALASLGRLHYKAGRYEDLLETYQAELRISGKNPQSAALLFKMGELYEERIGRDEDAIVSYRKAIEMDPFNQQALHALGRKLTERNRFDEYVKLLGARAELAEGSGAARAHLVPAGRGLRVSPEIAGEGARRLRSGARRRA